MRLGNFEIEQIKQQAQHYFGDDVKVYLFGSRTDDSKKGGDIDLYIQNAAEGKATLQSKIKFISALILKIGDQKIDVVLDHTALKRSMFYNSIKKNAILL